MKLAFLGLGRMGRELVAHILTDDSYEVTVWNRTPSKADAAVAAGAVLADSAADAVRDADVVVSCLFGPQSVREVILDAELPLASSAVWMDVTTVGPEMARQCDDWAASRGLRYVHAPVLGSLGPAKAGDLGVLIGGSDVEARAQARSISSLWADPDRVIEYDNAALAAVGKLVVNYGLAACMQGLIEASRLGVAGGLTPDQAVTLVGLPKTPLSVMTGMKGQTMLSGDYTNTQFSTNLLAKDVRLMLELADLPALKVALKSLEDAQSRGQGEDDFSAMAG